MTGLNENYHCPPEQYYHKSQQSIDRALRCGIMTADDVQLLDKFLTRFKLRVSPGRYRACTTYLCASRRFIPVEYRQVTDDILLKLFSDLRYAKREDGKPYTRNTISGMSRINKQLFTFLHEEGLVSIQERTLKQLTVITPDYHTKSDDDVYSAEEIQQMIDAAKSSKYKAYIGMLYETGGRSIELSNLKWKDLTFCDWGVSVNLTDTKTDKMRTVPIVTYAKYLYDWMNQYHPGEPEGENFVFVTPRGTPFRYASVSARLKIIAQEVGIEKPMTLHRFRHSRITHSLRAGMSETICKKAYWGNETTTMIGTYGHLTSQDIRDEVLRISGVEIPKNTTMDGPKPITCPNCHRVMPPGTKVCECGKILDEQMSKTMEGTIKTLDEWIKRHSDSDLLGFLSQIKKMSE